MKFKTMDNLEKTKKYCLKLKKDETSILYAGDTNNLIKNLKGLHSKKDS